MKVHANVPFRNEAVLLKHLVPIWNKYPIDEWVFFNDRSTDNSVEIVKTLDAKVTIIDNTEAIAGGEWHETKCRQVMLDYSRKNKAELIFAIDADEFLSSNMVKNWDELINILSDMSLNTYWYNFVDDTQHIRQDSQYLHNYKTFIMHVPSVLNFTGNLLKHTPRTPFTVQNQVKTKTYGLMHLQSMNVKFYALKQLWYKHWEYHVEKRPIEFINRRYDPVVNNLDFNKTRIEHYLVEGISLDPSIFDELLEVKGYKKYILENLVPELVTFGKEFLED
jgi:hypothetical protein